VLLIGNFALDSYVMNYFPIHLLLAFFALSYNPNCKLKRISAKSDIDETQIMIVDEVKIVGT
jgi:hypothetical protein